MFKYLRSFFLLLACLAFDSASSDQRRYAIVFDAGSSGTRVNVYEWIQTGNFNSSTGDLSDRAWYVREAIASLRQVGHKKIKPGVSDFKKAVPDGAPGLCNVAHKGSETLEEPPEGLNKAVNWSVNSTCLANAVEIYLAPLKEYALAVLPEDLVTRLTTQSNDNSPQQPLVMFYATAGMRLVSRMQEASILSAVRSSLNTGAFGAAFGTAPPIIAAAGDGDADDASNSGDALHYHVRVLSGPEEATLDWLAINAALGLNLQPSISLAQGPGGLNAVHGLADIVDSSEGADVDCNEESDAKVDEEIVDDEVDDWQFIPELEPVGALDLGGWSTQIAFSEPPRSSSGSRIKHAEKEPFSAAHLLSPASSKFVAASHLGFGVLGAFDLALDACAAHALALLEAQQGRIGDEPNDGNDDQSSSGDDEWHVCPCLSPGQEVVHRYRLPAYVPPRQRRPPAAVSPDSDGIGGGDIIDSQSEASAMQRRWTRHGAMAAGGDGSEVEDDTDCGNGDDASTAAATTAAGAAATQVEVGNEEDDENENRDEELSLAERVVRVGELAVFSDWEWEDWVSASDLDGNGAIDVSELVDVLQRRERTKPVALPTHVSPRDVADKTKSRSSLRMSKRFDASLDGSPDGGLTLAHDILDVADLDQSDDIDFAEFAAVQRGVLQSHPELMGATLGSSSTSGSRQGGRRKGEGKEEAKGTQRQGSKANHHHSQGNNDDDDDDDDENVLVVRLRGTGDALACRAIARGMVAVGISRSPEAAPWQGAKNDNSSGSDKHGEKNSDNNESGDASNGGGGLGSSQQRCRRDRGVFFAIDVFGTVGNQMLEKLLIRAASKSTLEPSEKKPDKEEEPISSTPVGVDISPDGSTIASSPASSAVESTSEDLLPKALRQLALTKPLVPYIDLGPELGQLRVVNLGCSAVRERWALRSSSQSNTVSKTEEESSLRAGSRQHPCGDPLDASANDNSDDRSASTSYIRGSSLTRYAAATAGQLAVGAVDLCAEPWPELLDRLGPKGRGENILKVERLCFGAAYVLELLSAYGLLRLEHEIMATTSGAGAAGAESGNESSSSNDGDDDDNGDVNDGAPRVVGRSDSRGSGGARVVFVESFGELEASWALGALVHRLLAEPPPA